MTSVRASAKGPLRFAGYAAIFNRVDGGKDTILKGAFARTLSEHADPLPLFWQHRPDIRIGWIESASEDERGLRVIAAIDNPHGRAGTMLKRRAIDGLSFGYRARGYRNAPSGRVLADIDLFEVSLVTHPLQDTARVHMIA